MKHFTPGELLEIVEGAAGTRPEKLRAHLDSCAACRRKVEELRTALSEAQLVPAGEPSPLFWDHFAARVSDAIREEPPGSRRGARLFGVSSVTAGWVTAALLLILATTATWRATLHAPPAPARSGASSEARTESSTAEDLDADEAWRIVRAAADGLVWDDAQAAGIVAAPGSAEGVAVELTGAERAELARILEGEMRRGGA
jgi:hypothetical protein